MSKTIRRVRVPAVLICGLALCAAGCLGIALIARLPAVKNVPRAHPADHRQNVRHVVYVVLVASFETADLSADRPARLGNGLEGQFRFHKLPPLRVG